MTEERFYADSMLGKLTRWLRLMGFSVEYASSDLADDEIIQHCKIQDLLLITRDRELSIRYKRSLYMESDNHVDQLRFFTAKFKPDPGLYFSRCPLCNGKVTKMNTLDYTGQLPEGVRLRQNLVYVCSDCGKVYWEGSHFQAILKKLNQINQGNRQ